jgi:M6 family metalloprotease-like protein
MPIPFQGQRFTFHQPDGAPIEVRGWGDQFSARFETLDGDPLIQNPATGYYELASVNEFGAAFPSGVAAGADEAAPIREKNLAALSASTRPPSLASPGLPRTVSRWEVRLGRKKLQSLHASGIAGPAGAPPTRTTIGTYVGLCVLIQFPDVTGTIARADVDDFCNKVGYTGFGNAGSVHDYYVDISGGRLQYTNIVTDYYTAQHPRDYYTDNSVAYPVRALELIAEALTALKTTGVEFTGLTTDGEHYVYAINVFYAGPCVNNWSEGLWPHSYHLPAPMELAPNILANDYQFTNMDSELSLATFCHENGHMVCDFPDLYDYDSAPNGVGLGDGIYCLMCYGGNASPKNPGQVCAYLKYRAGWADSVTPITDGLTATVHAGRNDFYILAKNSGEYFLIENRQAAGRDALLRDSGLAIWHVDEAGNNSYEQMTPTQHYECSLEQKDGRFDLERDRNDGDSSDLYRDGATFSDTTSPNSRWWDGTSSGLVIEGIGSAGTTMTFTARL